MMRRKTLWIKTSDWVEGKGERLSRREKEERGDHKWKWK